MLMQGILVKNVFFWFMCSTVKPIFHCDAKYLASGVWRWAMSPPPEFCVGDTNMLVYFGVT